MASTQTFSANDYPPMIVKVLKDRYKDTKTGTIDVREGHPGRYGGMVVNKRNGKVVSKIVTIAHPQGLTQPVVTDFENVSIHHGYPFLAHHSTGQRPSLDWLDLKSGDKGVIKRVSPHNRVAWAWTPGEDQTGWVSTNLITIGTERQTDD